MEMNEMGVMLGMKAFGEHGGHFISISLAACPHSSGG
jgi:hypothetical protein